MQKLPPIEKIPEAYSAIIDNRVEMFDDHALVKSSNREKEYLIRWQDNIYYSNDNSTYWQNYAGYPVLAVLMLQGKLSLNREFLSYFKNIDWNKLNKDNNRDYQKSLEQVLKDVDEETKNNIHQEFAKVYKEIENLGIELTKKKNFK